MQKPGFKYNHKPYPAENPTITPWDSMRKSHGKKWQFSQETRGVKTPSLLHKFRNDFCRI